MSYPSFDLPGYAELQCFSNFTFLHGASHAEEMAARAAQLGYEAIAVTDECSLAGIVRAHVAAKEAGIKLLVGAHFRADQFGRLSCPCLHGDRTESRRVRQPVRTVKEGLQKSWI